MKNIALIFIQLLTLIALTFSCSTPLKETKHYWDATNIKETSLLNILSQKNCNESDDKYWACFKAIAKGISYLQIPVLLHPKSNWSKGLREIKEYSLAPKGYRLTFAEKSTYKKIYNKLKTKGSWDEILKNEILNSRRKYPLNFIKIYAAIKKELTKEKTFKTISPKQFYISLINGYLPVIYGEYSYVTIKGGSSSYGSNITEPKLGITYFETNAKKIIILKIEKGGPADLAGLRYGDEIISLKNMYQAEFLKPPYFNVSGIWASLKGKKGDLITFKIRRKKKIITVSMKYANIKFVEVELKTLTSKNKKIAHIKLKNFLNINSCRNIRGYLKDNADILNGIILDLRDNGGGYTRIGKCITELFLPENKLINSYEDLQDSILFPELIKKVEKIESSDEIDTKNPLIILVNGGSASASEILGSALQDHNRAYFIGSPSFGKGLSQRCSIWQEKGFKEIPEAEGVLFCKTNSIIKRPRGDNIHAFGIKPHFQISPHPDEPYHNSGNFYKIKSSPLGRYLKKSLKKPASNIKWKNASKCLAKSVKRVKRKFRKQDKVQIGKLDAPDYRLMFGIEGIHCLQ